MVLIGLATMLSKVVCIIMGIALLFFMPKWLLTYWEGSEAKSADNDKQPQGKIVAMDKNEENVKKENEIKDLANAIESLKSTLYSIAMIALIICCFSSR